VRTAEVEALLNTEGALLESSAVYLAGNGYQLALQCCKKEDGRSHVGVFICPCAYKKLGWQLCPAADIVCCRFSIERLMDSGNKTQAVMKDSVTAVGAGSGFGCPDLIIASSPDDLAPYLVDGCLKLRATIQPVHGQASSVHSFWQAALMQAGPAGRWKQRGVRPGSGR
jgi:hypothetical protein